MRERKDQSEAEAVAVTSPKARRAARVKRLRDSVYYPFKRREWFARRARARRRQLRLSVARVRQPRPFHRFMVVMEALLFFVDVPLLMFAWIFASVETKSVWNVFAWFLGANMLLHVGAFTAVALHNYVMGKWPKSLKVTIGNSPEWSWDGVPGEDLDALELPMSEAGVKETIPVEVMKLGTVREVPHGLTRRRVFAIARCTVLDEKTGQILSGVRKGKRYEIAMKPDPFIIGDLRNWRLAEYLDVLKDHFGGEYTDADLLLIAMDPVDPVTWAQPPKVPTLKRELYLSRQRVEDLEARLESTQQFERGLEEIEEGGAE